jgi:hypothetical protein
MPRKITKEIVNQRLSERGIKLIGSYINVRTKTTFQCGKGHEWETKPDTVLRGYGCPICAGKHGFTKEEVNKRLEDRGVELIGDYIDSKTKTTFRCKQGHEWEARPAHILGGHKNGCPYCAGRAKLSKEIVNQRLADRGIKLIGDYVNTSTRSTFRCKHGHEWDAVADHVIRGSGCPECYGNIPLTKEIINERLSSRGIKQIGDYDGARTKTMFRCKQGHEWSSTPDNVTRGSGCPYCAGKAPLTKEIVLQRLKGRGIELIGEYKNASTPTTFRCEHRHEWETRPSNIVTSKHGCPYCGGSMKLTKDLVNQKIADQCIQLIGNYINNSTCTIFICDYGHEWETRPANVLRGSGCPVCAGNLPITKGEVNETIADRGFQLVGEYLNARTKTMFRCKQGHEWSSTPDNVTRGSGCPYCAGTAKLTKEIVNERISDRGIEMVGEYINIDTRATFRCEYGHEWETIPDGVIAGNGCPICSGTAPLSKEIVNERITGRGFKMISDYINTATKTTFRCDKGHEWNAKPSNIMHGQGCPTCAEYGFKREKPAILYYLRIDTRNQTLYKIGITNRTVEARFIGDMDKITILNIKYFDQGGDAYKQEQEIIKNFSEYHYSGGDVILSKGGNTELFTKDILGLDFYETY